MNGILCKQCTHGSSVHGSYGCKLYVPVNRVALARYLARRTDKQPSYKPCPCNLTKEQVRERGLNSCPNDTLKKK